MSPRMAQKGTFHHLSVVSNFPRKLLIFSILLSFFFLFSCGGLDISGKGEISTIEKQSLCPPSVVSWMPEAFKRMVAQAMHAVTNSLSSAISGELKKRDTWPVKDIRLIQFSFVMPTIPQAKKNSNTLGLFTNLTVYVTGNKGAPKILLMQAKNIPELATTITFNPTNANIQPYIEQGMKAEVAFSIRDCPRANIKFQPVFTAKISL